MKAMIREVQRPFSMQIVGHNGYGDQIIHASSGRHLLSVVVERRKVGARERGFHCQTTLEVMKLKGRENGSGRPTLTLDHESLRRLNVSGTPEQIGCRFRQIVGELSA